ncbi:MAG: hypothetical protein R2849_00155 [Thermomicrobiales bacterium]
MLIRGYAGRANDQESLDRSDDDLAAVFRRELAEITGLAAEPRFTRVYRWPRALPQYNPAIPSACRGSKRCRRSIPASFSPELPTGEWEFPTASRTALPGRETFLTG